MSADEPDDSEAVDRLLEDAEALLEDADDPEELLGDDDLQSVADEARSFLEDAETAELLEAVGVDAPEDGSPTDLLMGLEDADTEPLVRRRRLTLLSEVSGDGENGDDRSALEEFEVLGEVLEEGAEVGLNDLEGGLDADDLDALGDESAQANNGASSEDASDSGAETDADDVEADSDADSGETPDDADADDDHSETEDQTETGPESGTEDEEGSGAGESDGGLAEHAGALRDVVEEIKGRDPDQGDPPEDAADSRSEADEGEQDSTGTRSSKVAASDRADMRVPLRHSTIPK